MAKNMSIDVLKKLSEQLNISLQNLNNESDSTQPIKLESETVKKMMKETRKSMKTTQADLRDLSGIALGTIQKIEKGDLQVNLQNFISIMEVMGIELCLRKK
jgi:predicted transcriptional regulator